MAEESTRNPNTVFVRNLPFDATAAQLEHLFSEIGPVRKCYIVTDSGSKASRGFGYVHFSVPADAARAKEQLTNKPFMGRKIKLDFATPRQPLKERKRPRPSDEKDEEEDEFKDHDLDTSSKPTWKPAARGGADADEDSEAPPKKDKKEKKEKKGKEGKGKEEEEEEQPAATADKSKHKDKKQKKSVESEEQEEDSKPLAKPGKAGKGDKAAKGAKTAPPPPQEPKGKKGKKEEKEEKEEKEKKEVKQPEAQEGEKVKTKKELKKEKKAAGKKAAKEAKEAKDAALKDAKGKKDAQPQRQQQEKKKGKPAADAGVAKEKPHRLIIRNLPFNATEDDLRKTFGVFGSVQETLLAKKDGKARGFAFMRFENAAQATAALMGGNGSKIGGRVVAVDWCLPKDSYQSLQATAEPAAAVAAAAAAAPAPASAGKGAAQPAGKGGKAAVAATAGAAAAGAPGKGPKAPTKAPVKAKEEEMDEDDEEEEESEGEDEESGDDDDLVSDGEQSDGEESDDGDSGDKEKEDGDKPAPQSRPGSEGTLFIRNVSFDATEDDVKVFFERFGPLEYAKLVMDPESRRPRAPDISLGTAFVRYKDDAHASACLEAASKAPLELTGRELLVTAAVSREQAKTLTSAEVKATKPKAEDKRNLYLAREGAIESGAPAFASLSAADRAKRDKLTVESRAKMQNPNYYVSKTRLSVHNLPLSVTEVELRKVFSTAGRDGQKPALVQQAKVIRSTDRVDASGTPRSKGFGFVEFADHEEALAQLRHINNNPTIFGADRRPIVMFAWENARLLHQRDERLKKVLARPGARPQDGGARGGRGDSRDSRDTRGMGGVAQKRKADGEGSDPQPKRLRPWMKDAAGQPLRKPAGAATAPLAVAGKGPAGGARGPSAAGAKGPAARGPPAKAAQPEAGSNKRKAEDVGFSKPWQGAGPIGKSKPMPVPTKAPAKTPAAAAKGGKGGKANPARREAAIEVARPEKARKKKDAQEDRFDKLVGDYRRRLEAAGVAERTTRWYED